MADLSKWNFATDFTGEESASLIAGVDPARFELEREMVAPVFSRIKHGYDLACKHYKSIHVDGTNCDPEAKLPNQALESIKMRERADCALGHETKVEFGSWLVTERSDFERQTFTRLQLVDWLNAIGLTSVYPLNLPVPTAESPKLDKHLDTRERNTLLAIIGVLCKEAKIPYESHSKAANLIHRTAERMGVSIGETTIEGHLKKVREALGTRMK